MKPSLSRRKRDRAAPRSAVTSVPSTVMEPEVGASMVETQLSSVVFPEPLSPIMAMYSPGSAVKLTFFSASTRFPPRRVV